MATGGIKLLAAGLGGLLLGMLVGTVRRNEPLASSPNGGSTRSTPPVDGTRVLDEARVRYERRFAELRALEQIAAVPPEKRPELDVEQRRLAERTALRARNRFTQLAFRPLKWTVALTSQQERAAEELIAGKFDSSPYLAGLDEDEWRRKEAELRDLLAPLLTAQQLSQYDSYLRDADGRSEEVAQNFPYWLKEDVDLREEQIPAVTEALKSRPELSRKLIRYCWKRYEVRAEDFEECRSTLQQLQSALTPHLSQSQIQALGEYVHDHLSKVEELAALKRAMLGGGK